MGPGRLYQERGDMGKREIDKEKKMIVKNQFHCSQYSFGDRLKRAISYALVVLVMGIISRDLLMAVPQEDEDNYGKVIGQVVIQETGEPVNETFQVTFYDHRGDEYIKKYVETDDHGRFIVELFPYIYYLGLTPLSDNSKYCKLLSPFKLEEGKNHTNST